jgi:predicted Zn-dependent protease
LVFGEDPRDGFFRGDRFIHPTLRFELTFPSGWTVANTPEAVVGASEERDAALELTLAQEPTPTAALEAFSRVEGVSITGNERVRLNGLDAHAADFVVTTAQEPLAGKVLFVAHDDNVYQLIGYGVQARWDARYRAVTSAMGTFEALGSNEFRDVRPHRIRMVRLERSMTGQEFLRAYPSTVPDQDVLLANRVGTSERLENGRLMKQVAGGTALGG